MTTETNIPRGVDGRGKRWGDPRFRPAKDPQFKQSIFEDADPTIVGPTFTVTEVAKVFFNRTPHWVRWIEREGWLKTPDGESLVPREGGLRAFTLPSIEKIAYNLADNGRIDGGQLLVALRVVRSIADVWEMLPDSTPRSVRGGFRTVKPKTRAKPKSRAKPKPVPEPEPQES